MKATDFEYRHQTLIHQAIVFAGVLTYLVDPDDIVWRFVRNTSAPRFWERTIFLVATILTAMGAILCTRARVLHRLDRLGELLYAIGLGSLLPIPGFLILVFGECIRLLRLNRGDTHSSSPEISPNWGHAFRKEAVKWGILVTMLVFVTTLQDRYADILAAASFLLGLLLNAPLFRRPVI